MHAIVVFIARVTVASSQGLNKDITVLSEDQAVNVNRQISNTAPPGLLFLFKA